MLIDGLRASGISENFFFIENKKEGRIEIPLDSIDGFKIERPSGYGGVHKSTMTFLLIAVGILSKHLT